MATDIAVAVGCGREGIGMATIYHDKDADLSVLKSRTIGIIGYGNQGRAQALNLRDGGLTVTVGNIDDDYKARAEQDGWTVRSIPETVAAADVVMVLIPDEVQPQVFEASIRPGLRAGNTLCFASGYNIFYKEVKPPENVDVIMVAPRMIGAAVRRLYEQGDGYPCLVAVEQDATGNALATALAIAKGIGATRLGAFASSFREEAVIDLFAEQMLWPAINGLCTMYFEKLVEAGCDPEVVTTELHLSGEFLEIARAMILHGFFKQLKLHSHTSQYGQLSRMQRMVPDSVRKEADRVLEEITSGAFAKEWREEQVKGLPTLERLYAQTLDHPLARSEERLEDLRQIVARAHAAE